MTRTRQNYQLPSRRIRAGITPASFAGDDLSFDFVFATERRVLVQPYDAEPFLEVLGCEPGEVRLETFRAGPAILDSHGQPYTHANGPGLQDQVGRVLPNTAELVNREAIARGVLLDTESNRRTIDGVAQGVIAGVSVGAWIHAYRDVTTADDPLPVLRAVDWEPYEASLTPLPVDPGATIRSRGRAGELRPCLIERSDRERTQRVQAVELLRSRFRSRADVEAWAASHGFASGDVDELADRWRLVQIPEHECSRVNRRSVQLAPGVSAFTCTPRPTFRAATMDEDDKPNDNPNSNGQGGSSTPSTPSTPNNSPAPNCRGLACFVACSMPQSASPCLRLPWWRCLFARRLTRVRNVVPPLA